MLATSTPETVVPVAVMREAAGVPCVSTVCPCEGWWLALGGKLSPTGARSATALQWASTRLSFGVPDF